MNPLTPEQRTETLRRFEAKYITEPNSGCWLWTGSIKPLGYGRFKLPDGVVAGCGAMAASRASWIIHRGPIFGGLHVLHKCDVRCCVNPDHLFLGTHQENMADRWRKGRSRIQRRMQQKARIAAIVRQLS